MPVYSLGTELVFPHPLLSEPDGLLAVGGDLSVDRLLLAYRWGIFPWYHDDLPILWWWISPRLMLQPYKVHISHSMKTLRNKTTYRITMNTSFSDVMKACGTVDRPGQSGTWILPEMVEAYTELHSLGVAKSVEVWEDRNLIGGLYGVGIGKIFSGESMFALKPNASKLAFIFLCEYLHENNYEWIDCQQDTPHMRSMGAELIPEQEYLRILRNNHKEIENSQSPI